MHAHTCLRARLSIRAFIRLYTMRYARVQCVCALTHCASYTLITRMRRKRTHLFFSFFLFFLGGLETLQSISCKLTCAIPVTLLSIPVTPLPMKVVGVLLQVCCTDVVEYSRHTTLRPLWWRQYVPRYDAVPPEFGDSETLMAVPRPLL